MEPVVSDEKEGVADRSRPSTSDGKRVVGDREERRKREEQRALFVRHTYGFGQVFYVGLDSTWRWRYRIGDLYHHRFWSQAIRWAANPPEEARADGQVYLDLLERRGLVHVPSLRQELAAEVPYFAPLASGDPGEYGILLESTK